MRQLTFSCLGLLALASLTGCMSAPRYQPALAGVPTATVFIDGRNSNAGFFTRPDLLLEVRHGRDCDQLTYEGTISASDKRLSGPYRMPAGERKYLLLGRQVSGYWGGNRTQYSNWYTLSLLPEAGATYHIVLDTHEDDFTDLAVYEVRGEQRLRLPKSRVRGC